MKRLPAVLIASLLSLAVVQARTTASGPGGYEYSPGLTAAQRAQLRARMDRLLAPPRVLSCTLQGAITAVLNARGPISGLVGSLPRDLAVALNRAAIRTPVQLVLASRSATNTSLLGRVRRALLPTASATTMIATGDLLITVDRQGVTVYQSTSLADQVRRSVQQVWEALAKPGPRPALP